MFINPMIAIEQGWIRNVPKHCIQPNAIDIPISKLFELDQTDVFDVETKLHRNRKQLTINDDGKYWMQKGVYDFTTEVYVEVPKGIVGWLISRSTLNRNGVMIQSGLYDSGFNGPVCGMMYNISGLMSIQHESRVAQFILAESDSVGAYTGGYNVKEGEQWIK
jgi:deoxycytidine triphosphate deaminase